MKSKTLLIGSIVLVWLAVNFDLANSKAIRWPSPQNLSTTRYLSPQTFQGASSTTLEALSLKDGTTGQALSTARREGFKSVDFRLLSVEIVEGADGSLKARLPKAVEKLDGKRIGISGFAVPMTQRSEGPDSFILFESQDAMDGGLEPHLDRWIFVEMERPTQVPLDGPTTFFGVLQVGPTVISGQVQCLYRLKSAELHTENSISPSGQVE